MGLALRAAIRQFHHHPTFAIVTVIVLGLATGAAAAVYTIVDGVLLRPLPYAEPDRIVTIWDTNYEKGLRHELISPVNFMDYRALHVFADAAAWWRPDVNLTDPGLDPIRVRTIETSPNLFRLLGVSPQIGPGFPASPQLYSADLACVISDRLWRGRYGADPGLIGRQLRLNDTPYTVVGVMPAGFTFPDEVDVWERLRWDMTQHSRAAHFMEGVARLQPGTTLAQASNDCRALGERLAAEYAATNRAWSVALAPLLDDELGYYRPALFVLFGAVGLLLVIGCLNVTSLLLTRALSREREVAVRTALGASPRQLVAQFLTESVVLSAAGALCGLIAATIAVPLVVRLTPVRIPRLADASVNPRVLAFTCAIAFATTIVFGVVPGFVLLRRSVAVNLRERASSRRVRGVYHVIMAGEVALACALLVSSALLVRTVQEMTRVSLGVDADEVVVSSVQLSAQTARDFEAVGRIHAQILDRIREHAGVVAVGAANFLPLEAGWRLPVQVYGQAPPGRPEDAPQAQLHSISDGYFETMRASLVAGRLFTARDTVDAPGVVVVNETFAREFPAIAIGSRIVNPSTGIGPLGRNLLAAAAHSEGAPPGRLTFEVVGIVRDVRDVPLGQHIEPAIYFTARQFPFGAMFVAVRARGGAEARTAITSAVHAVAPDVPLGDTSTWGDRFRMKTAEPRLLMTVLVFFAALAALLASVGVYGLFSWLVALRRREVAIRLTLGARPAAVGAMVIRQSATIVAFGLAAGIVLVRVAAPFLAQVLFAVRTDDARSTIAATALLLVAAVVACAIPAARAAATDPADALRWK